MGNEKMKNGKSGYFNIKKKVFLQIYSCGYNFLFAGNTKLEEKNKPGSG